MWEISICGGLFGKKALPILHLALDTEKCREKNKNKLQKGNRRMKYIVSYMSPITITYHVKVKKTQE